MGVQPVLQQLHRVVVGDFGQDHLWGDVRRENSVDMYKIGIEKLVNFCDFWISVLHTVQILCYFCSDGADKHCFIACVNSNPGN